MTVQLECVLAAGAGVKSDVFKNLNGSLECLERRVNCYISGSHWVLIFDPKLYSSDIYLFRHCSIAVFRFLDNFIRQKFLFDNSCREKLVGFKV